MKRSKTMLAIVILVVAAGACTDRSRAVGSDGDYEGWACAPNRIAHTTFTLDYSASGEEREKPPF